MPPGASTAIPTITTGSAGTGGPASAIGIHLSGNGVDVLVEIEMPAVVQEQLEGARSVVFPEPQSLGIDPMVVACAQYANIGTNADTASAVVTIDRLVVRPHRSSDHFRELFVGE